VQASSEFHCRFDTGLTSPFNSRASQIVGQPLGRPGFGADQEVHVIAGVCGLECGDVLPACIDRGPPRDGLTANENRAAIDGRQHTQHQAAIHGRRFVVSLLHPSSIARLGPSTVFSA